VDLVLKFDRDVLGKEKGQLKGVDLGLRVLFTTQPFVEQLLDVIGVRALLLEDLLRELPERSGQRLALLSQSAIFSPRREQEAQQQRAPECGQQRHALFEKAVATLIGERTFAQVEVLRPTAQTERNAQRARIATPNGALIIR